MATYRINHFNEFDWRRVADFVQISPTHRGRLFPALNNIMSDSLYDPNWVMRNHSEGYGLNAGDGIWSHRDTQIIQWNRNFIEIIHNGYFDIHYIRINKRRQSITVENRKIREMRWPV